MRSGHIILSGVSGTTFEAAGVWNGGWSSWAVAYTSSISATAYYLGFGSSTVVPSNTDYRYMGNSLRCLSTVLDI